MKIRVILGILGSLLKMLGLLMLAPGAVATIYGEPEGIIAFALASMSALFAGIILKRLSSAGEIGIAEAFAVVSVGWLCAVVFGALPFVFNGIDVISALFESMSGFTATGATVLTEKNSYGYYIINATLTDNSMVSLLLADISSSFNLSGMHSAMHLPAQSQPHTFYGLLFWRALSQLIGGLGIILLYLAIFPALRVAGRQLYKAEIIGPTKDTIVPRARETARILWEVYLLFIGAEILLLTAAGMPIYDAVCNSFTSLATGGFSPKADSIAAYGSPLIEGIIMIFIFLGASSFALHYRALANREIRGWAGDPELRFFAIILAITTVSLMLFGGIGGDIPMRFRLASFQGVSFMGTCGFVNTLSYNSWSTAAKLALIMVMLIGGCAGSTAGGIKVMRLLVALKYAYSELVHMLHPKVIRPIRLGQSIIKEDVLRPILFYSFFYLAAFFTLSLALAMASTSDPKVDLLVVISGVASCMGGVGPAFGTIAFDWSSMSPLGKMIGFLAMYVGRLEILPIMVIFMPELWEK
jgi:trk system potassium uptake protein TrkH